VHSVLATLREHVVEARNVLPAAKAEFFNSFVLEQLVKLYAADDQSADKVGNARCRPISKFDSCACRCQTENHMQT